MKYKLFHTLLLVFFFHTSTHSQTTADNLASYKVGDKVEAEYTTWYPGKIVEILYGGDQYKVELYPPDGGRPFIYQFPKFRLRPSTKPALVVTADDTKLIYGKYGCTATEYRNGSYNYIPRGSFTINKNGKYSYAGFQKPSSGTFTVTRDGNLLFKGGYLDGGKAEKIDRPNKFFLVFPTNPDNRWTATLVSEK
jgi:hypothetical protein